MKQPQSNNHGRISLGAAELEVCEQAVRLHPGKAEPLSLLGLCLLRLSRFHEASAVFQKAVDLEPSNAGMHFMLAAAFQRLNDERAITEMRAGIVLQPRKIQAHKALVDGLIYFQQYEAAVTAAKTLLNLKPGDPQAQEAIAQALHALQRVGDLDLHLERWLRQDRKNYNALIFAGNMRLEEGDFESARVHFMRAQEADPARGPAYFGLVQCGAPLDTSSSMVQTMLSLARRGTLSPQEKTQLQLALGQVFERNGEYELSTYHYDQANQIVLSYLNATNPFRVGDIERVVTQVETLFTKEFFAKQKPLGHPSDLPILVIGMIRSGTTLTEQILASHPQVAGAGEQTFWSKREGTISKWLIQQPSQEEIGATGEEYLSILRNNNPCASRVVDKMPGNFFSAGLIHAHFPNARFVHLRRHPVDTCLSIWTTHFQSPPRFSASRPNIVHLYRQYLRVMEHWRAVLPADRLLEIDYEDLVGDKEAVIRKLVAFCGLGWSDSCLFPELNNSRVSTPSLARVRAPIDSTRVERWRRFEPWLGEFKELL